MLVTVLVAATDRSRVVDLGRDGVGDGDRDCDRDRDRDRGHDADGYRDRIGHRESAPRPMLVAGFGDGELPVVALMFNFTGYGALAY